MTRLSGSAVKQTGAGARAEEYRRAERELWAQFGITATERTVELPSYGVGLRIVEAGEGTPVVLVPGTGGVGPYWAPLVSRLEGFRCLMMDRPGWGLSPPIDFRRFDYKTVVADLLRETLDGLGLDHASFVGASVGGLWALRFAAAYPHRLDRAVPVGAPTQAAAPPAYIRMLASPLGALMVRVPAGEAQTRSILRQLGHRQSIESGRFPESVLTWRVAFQKLTDSLRNEREMVRAVVHGSHFRPGFTFEDDELARIPQPVLQVVGGSDPVGDPAQWRHSAETLPRGVLRVLDGAGHTPWLDDPVTVGGWVSAFLRGEDT
ncbi:MAG: alpha/beta fold hydrolase [Micromonosporaceae bacterium]